MCVCAVLFSDDRKGLFLKMTMTTKRRQTIIIELKEEEKKE